MRYTNATEQPFPTCLPPEAYIRICKTIEPGHQPKFSSSVYPTIKEPNKRKRIIKKDRD
jgi:hypothetical protein